MNENKNKTTQRKLNKMSDDQRLTDSMETMSVDYDAANLSDDHSNVPHSANDDGQQPKTRKKRSPKGTGITRSASAKRAYMREYYLVNRGKIQEQARARYHKPGVHAQRLEQVKKRYWEQKSNEERVKEMLKQQLEEMERPKKRQRKQKTQSAIVEPEVDEARKSS